MLKNLSPQKTILPVLVGLAAIVWMIMSDDSINLATVKKSFSRINIWWVVAAFFVLFVRDFGYMYRIRNLTGKALSWKSSFFVIMLWEFASAITPSVVGGTSVAVFIMNREKIPFGKALSYVMLTAILDNLFFVFASITVLQLFPGDIFPINDYSTEIFGFTMGLRELFYISVSLIALYTLFMMWGLFIGPHTFKKLLVKLTSFNFTKRWHKGAVKSGNEMILASQELKGHSWGYWINVCVSTVFIWTARYLMLNCLINAFLHIDLFNMSRLEWYNEGLIFARQIIMWIVMLISPTPGSAGTAEYFFGEFFGEFFSNQGIVLIVAIFWRLLTYYTYLFAGVILLPKWVQRVFGEEEEKEKITA